MRCLGRAFAPVVVVALIATAGCATYGDSLKNAKKQIASSDYKAAEKSLEKPLSPEGDDRLLYHLELGMVKHLAGEFEASNRLLDNADRIARNLQTKRVSEALTSMMTSPRDRPYAGREFERVYINYYKAMNYLGLAREAQSPDRADDHVEAARVEIRRMNNILDAIAHEKGNYQSVKDKEKKLFTKLLDIFNKLRGNLLNERMLQFREDASAHYVSGMLYEKRGEMDNARIQYEKAAKLYENGYAEQYELGEAMTRQAWFDVVRVMKVRGGYGTEARRLAEQKLTAAQRKRLAQVVEGHEQNAQVFLLQHVGFNLEPKEMNLFLETVPNQESFRIEPVLNGTPRERRAQAAWFALLYADKGIWDMVEGFQRGGLAGLADQLTHKTIFLGPAWKLARDAGVVEAIGAGGVRVTVPYYMPPARSLDAIHVQVDGQSRGTLARAESLKLLALQEQLLSAGEDLKMALARATLKNMTASKTGSAVGGWAGVLTELFGRIAAFASSRAETRSWVTLPGSAHIGRLTLEPGKHTLRVQGYNNGAPVMTATREVDVEAGDVVLWKHRLVKPE